MTELFLTGMLRGVSSVGRARRSQRRGRGFESLTLHHLKDQRLTRRNSKVVAPSCELSPERVSNGTPRRVQAGPKAGGDAALGLLAFQGAWGHLGAHVGI